MAVFRDGSIYQAPDGQTYRAKESQDVWRLMPLTERRADDELTAVYGKIQSVLHVFKSASLDEIPRSNLLSVMRIAMEMEKHSSTNEPAGSRIMGTVPRWEDTGWSAGDFQEVNAK